MNWYSMSSSLVKPFSLWGGKEEEPLINANNHEDFWLKPSSFRFELCLLSVKDTYKALLWSNLATICSLILWSRSEEAHPNVPNLDCVNALVSEAYFRKLCVHPPTRCQPKTKAMLSICLQCFESKSLHAKEDDKNADEEYPARVLCEDSEPDRGYVRFSEACLFWQTYATL